MRTYPHGLDDEILQDDLEIELETVKEVEEEIEEERDGENALLFQALGEANYAVGCYSYAMGDSPEKIKKYFDQALENHFTSLKKGIIIDPFEFLTLLSLSIVRGNKTVGEELAKFPRDRYTNQDVQADELIFTIAELMSAFVRRDENSISRILAANNPETIDTKNIYRYDRMIFFPLLPLLSALQKKEANRFVSAMNERDAEFVRFHKRSNEKNNPEILIDINGLAILALAKERGIVHTLESVYRPVALIKES